MTRRARLDVALAVVAAIAVSLAIWRSLPVSDDWGLLLEIHDMEATGHFEAEIWRPQVIHWSPLWFLASRLCFHSGFPDYGRLPLTLVRIAGLAAMFAAALTILRHRGAGVWAAAATLLVVAFHQGDVAAFAQWKSIGAIGANAAGGWAAALMIDRDGSARRRGVLAALLIAVAVLFKEIALCYAAFAVLLLIVVRPRPFARTLPAIGVAVVFALVRGAVGTPVTLDGVAMAIAEPYSLGSPLDWARNAASLMLATFTPVSTVRWIDAVRAHAFGLVALFVVVTLLVNLPLALTRDRRLLVPLLGLVAAPFPVLALHHVSENYVTPLVFWYAIAIGFVVDAARKRWMLVLVAVAIALHVASFAEKATMTAASSQAEARAAEEGVALLRRLPPGSLVDVDIAKAEGHYSSYRSFDADIAMRYVIRRLGVMVDARAGHRGEADYVMRMRPEGVALTSIRRR